MTGRRTERIAGFLVVEEPRLDWWVYQLDKVHSVIVCGELGHIHWLFWRLAWREVVKREHELTMSRLAQLASIK